MSTSNPKSKAVSLFLILLVVVLGSTLTYLSTISKNSKNNVVSDNGGLKDTKLGGPESEGITDDPMAGWKTYTSEEYGFSFKYPAQFYLKAFLPNSITIANEPLPDGQLDPTRRISITVDSLYSSKYEQIRNAKAGADVPEAHHAVDVVIEKVRNFTVDNADAVEYYRDGVSNQSEIGRGFIGYERIILIRSSEDKYIQLLLTSSSVEETNQWSEIFDQILSTFEFVDDEEASDFEITDVVVRNTFFDGEAMDQSASRYTFKYPSKDVSSVDMLSDGSFNVSGILIKLNNGVDLTIKPVFEGSSVSYNDVDGKPSTKTIYNPNFVEKITRVFSEVTKRYSYVTGYAEGSTGCSHWDPLPLACHMSNAGFNKIGGYEISCNTKDISKVKMCDDIVGNLAISVEKVK